MARSSYIYVVLGVNSMPIAAFTVKHELVAWLQARTGSWAWDRHIAAFRLRDGGRDELLTERLDVRKLVDEVAK